MRTKNKITFLSFVVLCLILILSCDNDKPTGTAEFKRPSSFLKTYDIDYVDWSPSIISTKDGSLILAGSSWGTKGSRKYIIKVNEHGTLLWTRQFSYGRANTVTLADDGSLLIGGFVGSSDGSDNDANVFKTDSRGALLWESVFGSSDEEVINSVAVTDDGGCIALGYSKRDSLRDRNLLLVKIDNSGKLEWRLDYDSTRYNMGSGICRSPDDGFMVVGMIKVEGISRSLLMKLDANGDTLWSRINTDFFAEPLDIFPQDSGGYGILVSNSSPAIWFVDANGERERTSGCYNSSDIYSIAGIAPYLNKSIGSESGFIVVPINDHIDILEIIGSDSRECRSSSLLGNSGLYYTPSSVCNTPDGGIAIAGRVFSGSGGFDFFVLKLDSLLQVEF